MAGLYESCLCCFWTDIPPTRQHVLIWSYISIGITALIMSLIWIASSLVGEIISAFTESKTCFLRAGAFSPPSLFSDSEDCCASNFSTFLTNKSKIGSPKHSVLPYPVLAAITRSMCDYKCTKLWPCTSVGAVKLLATRVSAMVSFNSNWVQFSICFCLYSYIF